MAFLHSYFWTFFPAFYNIRVSFGCHFMAFEKPGYYINVSTFNLLFLPHAAGQRSEKIILAAPFPADGEGTFLATQWLNKESLHAENQDTMSSPQKKRLEFCGLRMNYNTFNNVLWFNPISQLSYL